MTETPTPGSEVPVPGVPFTATSKPAPAATPSSPTTAPADDYQVLFSIYDGTTGAIRVQGSCPYSMAMIQPCALHEGMIFEFLQFDTHYIDVTASPHASRERPTLPPFDKMAIKADQKDAATMQMPVDGKATIDGVTHDVPAGPFSVAVDMPGDYEVRISAFPYLDLVATIKATA